MKYFLKRLKTIIITAIIVGSTAGLLSCEMEMYTGGIVRVENRSANLHVILETVTDSSDAVLHEDIDIEDYRDFPFEKAGAYTFTFGNGEKRTVNLKDNDRILITVTNY